MINYKEKICIVCNKKYYPASPFQKYCTECSIVIKAETKEQRKKYDHERYLLHREEYDARSLAWSRNNPEKRQTNRRKNVYGLNQEEYDTLLLAQGDKCAVCGRENSGQIINGKYCPMLVDCPHPIISSFWNNLSSR